MLLQIDCIYLPPSHALLKTVEKLQATMKEENLYLLNYKHNRRAVLISDAIYDGFYNYLHTRLCIYILGQELMISKFTDI